MLVVKNGNGKLKNYFDAENEKTLKFKKGMIEKLKLNTPLFSWPSDRDKLMAILVNTLYSTKSIADRVDGEGVQEVAVNNPEYLAEEEYVTLPEQVYHIDGCNAKVLGLLVRLLNYRAKVLRKIKGLKSINASAEQVNSEIEKVIVYNIVLAKYLPILNQQSCIEVVNVKQANKLFEDVCTEGYEELPTKADVENEIKKNKEEQDFDIVSALAYCGVDVDKDDFGYYTIKGYENGNGIKYYIGKREKTFALSKETSTRFVEEFLNKPIESRKFITPGQVFISYIGEAERSLGINSRSAFELNEIFGVMANNKNAKTYFKEVIKHYSRNAKEWKDFQKLFYSDYYANKETKDDIANRLHIKQQAKRLVIGELFEEFLNGSEILQDEQLNISDYRASDISRDFGLEFNLNDINVNRSKIERFEDQAFRVINTLHSSMQEIRLFTQDIIDNYTVDYLRKEKIFLLQQDDQNEFINKKKEYEDLIEKLAIEKGKDTDEQALYYQQQIDDLTQKIGNAEYKEAKNTLLTSKNNFRILLLNAKIQKETIKEKFAEAEEKANLEHRNLTYEEKIEIIKQALTVAPDLVVTFAKGKAYSWAKHKVGEKAEKSEEKLSNLDKIIETTASRISNESHMKILEENKIRDAVKKSQKQEREKSVNAYINAVGSIVGSASNVGAYSSAPIVGGVPNGGGYPAPIMPKTPNFGGSMPVVDMSSALPTHSLDSAFASAQSVYKMQNPHLQNSNATNNTNSNGGVTGSGMGGNLGSCSNATNGGLQGGSANSFGGNGVQGVQSNQSSGVNNGQFVQQAPMQPQAPVQPMPNYGAMPMAGMMGGMMMAPNYMPPTREYQNVDVLGDSIEPLVIPYIVGYESKGHTVYGNAMESYATFDRYKFLLTTNNNALYTYVENKKAQIQTPEQIITDLHIRYVKVAMGKSGFSTLDSNLSKFDPNGDVRKFLSQYVPQNVIDIIISDYKEMITSIDFDLLKDLIDKKFANELESYIPENIKDNIIKSANMIASVVKAIMTDISVKKTYEAYSSKMKQNYINSLVAKIENGDIPTIKVNDEEVYDRMVDYLSFSCKGQNVIIENEDQKNSGLGTYPRATFFKQKNNADTKLRAGKVLSYEQNEIITSDNNPSLSEDNDIVNLFGTLYKFNGAYNKLLLKLKPFTLNSGVKFMENLVDSLKEKIDIKATVIQEKEEKPKSNLVKIASKEKKKDLPDEIVFNYEDDKWYVRKGFVLDKIKIKEFYYLLAFGFKYALDKDKKLLKEDFYQDNLLSLSKINEKFKDQPQETIDVIISVIRAIMMSKCERIIDLVKYLYAQFNTHMNKMIYISNTILESRNFDKKPASEKLEALDILDTDFNIKIDDIVTPHPEIYASIEQLEQYQNLYIYYAMFDLFEKMPEDERFITAQLSEYYLEFKKNLRTKLLAMIRDKEYMNGYELEIANYFELNQDKLISLDDKPEEEVEEEAIEEEKPKDRVRIKNIDIIFRGIYEGYQKALKIVSNQKLLEELNEVNKVLELVGDLPNKKNQDKELEIALPNNQTILCNIKGFMQQYLFRYIVDKEHELGPFAYVVSELVQHEEYVEIVKNIEIVADKLNATELGINLFAGFSTINMSNNGHIFKIGDNISTVLEIVNRLKTPTDMQKALNRDIFYKEGVQAVQTCFEEYFKRRELEMMN